MEKRKKMYVRRGKERTERKKNPGLMTGLLEVDKLSRSAVTLMKAFPRGNGGN